MKRIAIPIVVLVILAGAGLYFQRRIAPHARPAANWLPATTILFEDVPDIHRTAERWPDTEVAQIIAEPEVQSFLQRPMSEGPRHTDLGQWLDQARQIDPLHFFLAVTDWSGSAFPTTIAGLYFGGSRQDMDTLVDNLRKKAQAAFPEGKSDVEKYGSGEIETFTTPTFSAALAYRGQWFFISTDATLLKSTLDRFEGQQDPNSLAELPAFKTCLQHLPPEADSVFFLQPAFLADKAASFALMLNPTADTHGSDDLKKIQGVSIGLKLDGEVMRDATYVVNSEPSAPGSPLAVDAIKLSSSDTIILMSNRLGIPGNAQMPDPKADPSGTLALVASYLKYFNDQGLGLQQFSQAFGPESGFVLDWPSNAVIPTPVVMLDVRDSVLARKFLDTLATLPLDAGVNFTRQDAGKLSLYTLPSTGIGFFPIQASLGLTDKCLIGALNVETVKQAAIRWETPGGGLDATDVYKKAAPLVSPPASSFAYLDSGAVFGRAYGLFRGVASMGFIPHLAEYVDLGKLPAPETITRHLSPMVASASVKDGGLLSESAGPVTSMQATIVAAAALGTAAIPFIEAEIKGQSVAIPGFPGLSPSPSQPSRNPFASPLFPNGSTFPPAQVAPTQPPTPAPSASPSGGNP